MIKDNKVYHMTVNGVDVYCSRRLKTEYERANKLISELEYWKNIQPNDICSRADIYYICEELSAEIYTIFLD